MYAGIAVSRETSSQFIQTPRPRHPGTTLSPFSRFTRESPDARFSNLPARPGRLGPLSRPARQGLPARS
eukprot:6633309-Pyramimonas_sp.AAC.1